MKLSRLIKDLYQQIFIGIVVQHASVKIWVQIRKGKKLEKEVSRVFDISNASLSPEAESFIKSYMDESPFSYVAVLNDALAQGAVPTCSMHEAENFTDMGSCVTLCNENRWMAYAEKPELNKLQKRFSQSGLDFIFSPFFILSTFFADKLEGKTALLALIQDDYLSLSIFNEGKLLFAQHYMTHDTAEDETMSVGFDENAEESLGLGFEEGEDLSVNLDDIDALDELDALDDLDDLQDLDDLDDLDEIEDFEESLDEAVEESEIALEEAKTKYDSKVGSFSDDYKRFQLIQASLQKFYSDERYNNQFVEEIYIADATETGPDLIQFIEEELFVSAFKRTIDLDKEVVKMALTEAKYAI